MVEVRRVKGMWEHMFTGSCTLRRWKCEIFQKEMSDMSWSLPPHTTNLIANTCKPQHVMCEWPESQA